MLLEPASRSARGGVRPVDAPRVRPATAAVQAPSIEWQLQHRLTPSAFQRAVTLSHYFDVDAALSAGIFDELAEANEVLSRAKVRAAELRELDQRAHMASKRRIRAAVIRRIRRAVWLDLLDAILIGLRGARPR